MSSEPAISPHRVSKVFDLGLSGGTDSFVTIIGARVRHPTRGGGSRRERIAVLDDVSFDVAPGASWRITGFQYTPVVSIPTNVT